MNKQQHSTRFLNGLLKTGLSSNLDDYKFVGGQIDEYNQYFLDCGFTESERPPHTNKCICGQANLKYNFYLLNIKNGLLFVIGKNCLDKFMPKQATLKCQT